MSEIAAPAEGRQPVVVIVVGRQRVGKTSFLNTTVQFLRAHGGDAVVWNADKLNRTYSLSMFSDDVLEPTGSDGEDVKAWLEGRFAHLVEHRYNAVLDIGGGDTPLARLVEEVPIVRTLERRGIRMLLVHVLGPEMADLDYLEKFMAENLLAPEATLIVLNDGLVLSGRSAHYAFSAVKEHPALLRALAVQHVGVPDNRLPAVSPQELHGRVQERGFADALASDDDHNDGLAALCGSRGF